MRVYGSLRVHGRCSAWRTWLDCVYLRTVACDYARLRVRGEGSFVCQFACCVFAIFGIFGVTAVFACAWSRDCWFACLLRLRDLWYLWYLRDPWYLRMFACLHVCSGLMGRVFAVR